MKLIWGLIVLNCMRAILQDEDVVLAKNSKSGDLHSFEALVKKYQQPIYRKAKSILRDEDKAKDVMQDTFIKAYKHINRFDVNRPFRPWIYKIMTNTAYDLIKKEKRLVPIADDIPMSGETTLERIIKIEEVKQLLNALKKLPDMYKIPIESFYMKNLSYNSIAINMQLPINTIRTRIHRGKAFLRNELS